MNYAFRLSFLLSIIFCLPFKNSSAKGEVEVNCAHYAEAGGDRALCEGNSVVIGGSPTTDATGGDVLIEWTTTGNPAAISNPNAANPVVSPLSFATFTVCVTSLGCTECDEVDVFVNPQPFVDGGPDVTSCEGVAVQIGGNPTAASDATIQWTPSGGLNNPFSQNPLASPTVTTTYTVSVTRGGCTITDQVTVYIQGCFPSPMAFDDIYETDQGTVLSVPDPDGVFAGILENDTGIGVLRVIGTNPTLSLTSTVDPSNTIEINSDGSFVYSPGSDFSGTDSFLYEICDNNLPQSCDVGVIYIVVNPCIDIQLAVWLEGPYWSTLGPQGMMSTFLNLRQGDFLYRGVLPGQRKLNIGLPGIIITPPFQPYSNTPWNYNGTEGLSDAPPWYYAPGSTEPMGDPVYAVYHPDVVDWVLVRFRTGNILPFNNTVVVKTAAALLLKDGTIRFLENCVLKASDLSSSQIFCQIDHRNHMAVLTPSSIDISGGVCFFDFRIQNSFLISTSFGQKEVEPGVWVMYAGDANQANDAPNYDITGQDNILWSNQNGSFDQYLEGDFELNCDVTGNDKIVWSANNGIANRVPKD